MNSNDATPDEIASLREMSGLSVEALALRAGLRPNDLAEMEAGHRRITGAIYDQVFRTVENIVSEMDDPGPLWA